MGLIKAAKDTVGGLLAEQWREYFYCDALSEDVLMVKGRKKVSSGRNSNKGNDNIISDGSIIAVNEGQCMMIIDQGKVVEISTVPGEFIYDASAEPSILYMDNLEEDIKNVIASAIKRFSFGGVVARDQRVYFINTREIFANKYGAANPIPFRVIDRNIGLDVDISIRCNGEYTFKIKDPLTFYRNVAGNVPDIYEKKEISNAMKQELVYALETALPKISAKGVRYSEMNMHIPELVEALQAELTEKWRTLRGIELVSMTFNGKASQEDEAMIKELQKTAVYRSADMAAANLGQAQAEAMKAAASNTATGPMMAFAGMNMVSAAGGLDVNQLYAMSAQQKMQQPKAQPVPGWICSCGKTDNRGKFCMECGAKKPDAAGWTCSCGTVNQGKFCVECGMKKPQGAPLYKCDKCGWEPDDPVNPPKFCPECGDIFDEKDVR